MSAEDLISRLTKARRTGNGTWLACCPAHEDKSPSMSVRELDDGRVLIHCFAGCGFEEIVGAVGLDIGALFPERGPEHARPMRVPFPAADVLAALSDELGVIAMIVGDVEEKRQVSSSDMARLRLARERVDQGKRFGLGLEIRAGGRVDKNTVWWR